MPDIKPIETIYNGYKFRSRLEARWAVFFDVGKIKYEYEPEGFELPNGQKYLPDFYLPKFEAYVEVKGERPEAWEELEKASNAIYWGSPVKRIIILSSIPTSEFDGGLWHFPCFTTFDGELAIKWWFFYQEDDFINGNVSRGKYKDPYFYWAPKGESKSFQAVSDKVIRERSYLYQRDNHIKEFELKIKFDVYRDLFGREEAYERIKQDLLIERDYNLAMNALVFEALDKARQARFEHGETPVEDWRIIG